MSKSKKILVLVESLDENDSSGTKGRVALLKNMAAAGMEVTALHYTQKEVTIDGIKTIAVYERHSIFYFLSRLQRYLYKWFSINIGDGYEKRFGFSFNWKSAVYAFAKALKKYNPSQYDAVWTLGKGTNFRAHAAVLQTPQWHSRWYAYVHDPYPQQLYPRPYNYVPLGYKQKRLFFAEVTKCAHKVVFPSLLLKEWMESYFVDVTHKSVILPHQITQVNIGDTSIPKYFKQDSFTLLHGGNLLDLRDPKPIVHAFKQFLAEHPEAKEDSQLLFLGKQGRFDAFLKEAQAQTPQVYASEGYVPFEQVYQMQQQASVNIILEAQSEISPFLPGKFAHCVAANAPILLVGPYYSECKRLLNESYPYSFEFKEEEKLKMAIIQLYTSWKRGVKLTLDRPDLYDYLSVPYLSNTLS